MKRSLYHVALPEDWGGASAGGEYRISTRGRHLDDVGFIHLAYADQVSDVIRRYYGDLPAVVVLEIDAELVPDEIRDEFVEAEGARFPHLYGPLPTGAVVGERPVTVGRD